MLVLTRKKSQMIRIGNDIVVKVIQTGKGSVKIGVDAPRDVRVVRGELEFHDAESADVSEDAKEPAAVSEVADADTPFRRESEAPLSHYLAC